MRRLFRDGTEGGSMSARDTELLGEQFRSLSAMIPTMYLIIVSNSLFLEFVTAANRADLRAYPVSTMLALASLVRIIFWYRSRNRPQAPEMIRSMLRSTIATSLVISIGLAVWSIDMLQTIDPGLRSYVPLFTALTMITCAACLTALPPAAYLVVGAGTLPIATWMLFSGEIAIIASGFNLLIIGALTVGLVRRQFRQLRGLVAAHGETRRQKQRAAELAYTDTLTKLPNRRAFVEALAELDGTPAAERVAVAMLDLDGFKAINDSLGHVAGDGLLAAVGERLSKVIQPGDMLARLGGDEFALLMRDAQALWAARERLLPIADAFDMPFAVNGTNLMVRTSIGVAHCEGGETALVELLHRADLALYDAKASGLSEISAFEHDMAERMRRRLLIEQAASDDLALSGLTVHFQPIVRTADLMLDGFETLARWRHPELGDISPEEFIGIAELRGLTSRLTAVLFRQAVEEAARWPDHLRLSFNLSAVELASPRVCEMILSLCDQHGFSPERLSIEITETALLNDFETALAVIDKFRAGGAKIMLDDFGAGFASIGYLRKIQFDGIKLDGSLIGTVASSAIARDLLLGVLQLCHAIKTPVTAEMVETQEDLELLRALGVDKVQGYLFGRPTPIPVIDAEPHLRRAG
jgi:diguanylate cyclase (GGDEF)-like protein